MTNIAYRLLTIHCMGFKRVVLVVCLFSLAAPLRVVGQSNLSFTPLTKEAVSYQNVQKKSLKSDFLKLNKKAFPFFNTVEIDQRTIKEPLIDTVAFAVKKGLMRLQTFMCYPSELEPHLKPDSLKWIADRMRTQIGYLGDIFLLRDIKSSLFLLRNYRNEDDYSLTIILVNYNEKEILSSSCVANRTSMSSEFEHNTFTVLNPTYALPTDVNKAELINMSNTIWSHTLLDVKEMYAIKYELRQEDGFFYFVE